MSDHPEHAFLGEEFLTWLWARSETGKADYHIDGDRHVAIALDDLLVFGGGEPDEMQQTLRNGLPTRSSEARAALADGKRPRKAKMILAEGSEQWSFTLDAATLGFGSVRCPETESDEEAEPPTPGEVDSIRIDAFVRLGENLDGVYKQFLQLRLNDGWETSTLRDIRQWAGAR